MPYKHAKLLQRAGIGLPQRGAFTEHRGLEDRQHDALRLEVNQLECAQRVAQQLLVVLHLHTAPAGLEVSHQQGAARLVGPNQVCGAPEVIPLHHTARVDPPLGQVLRHPILRQRAVGGHQRLRHDLAGPRRADIELSQLGELIAVEIALAKQPALKHGVHQAPGRRRRPGGSRGDLLAQADAGRATGPAVGARGPQAGVLHLSPAAGTRRVPASSCAGSAHSAASPAPHRPAGQTPPAQRR